MDVNGPVREMAVLIGPFLQELAGEDAGVHPGVVQVAFGFLRLVEPSEW